MPIMDGYEASKAIRELENIYRIPRSSIVAVTAHNSELHRRQAY